MRGGGVWPSNGAIFDVWFFGERGVPRVRDFLFLMGGAALPRPPPPPPLYFGFSVYHGRIDTNILRDKITPAPISGCGVFVALSHYRVPENQFSWRKQEMPSLFICTQKIIGR